MKINDIHIKMFRAGSGDCILLEFEKADGSREISYMQGNSVAELLIKNNYHWNTSVKGSSISTDTIKHKAFGNITFQILNPTQKILNELAEDWLWMLKAKCKQVIISENSLFDDAFEEAYIGVKSFHAWNIGICRLPIWKKMHCSNWNPCMTIQKNYMI